MSVWRKVTTACIAAGISGTAGFSVSYYSGRDQDAELLDPLKHAAQMKMDDLAYAFAPGRQVEMMIAAEPPQPPEWAHTEERVALLRKLRLAVVAASSEKRERLLREAEEMCGECSPESLRKMFRRYAQGRLVPPGDDIECDGCRWKREPLAPEPSK